MEKYRANTTRDVLIIESEPYVYRGYRGFALAVVARKVDDPSKEYELQVDGLKSLADGLEPLLKKNQGSFSGLKFGIKKASKDKSSNEFYNCKNQ